jgi:hypothetical protein
MLHFSAVPLACRYRPNVLCPLAETLHGREESELVEEALPCASCAHHLTAFTPVVERRWHLGKTELAILLAACVHHQRFYPLIRQMTVDHADRQGNRRRFLQAAKRLAACGAVRLLQLPTQQPRQRRILLRETTWLQVTVLGRLLNHLSTPGHGGYDSTRRKRALAQRLHVVKEQVRAEPAPLLEQYTANLTELLQRVIDHVSLATPAVVRRVFTVEGAAFLRASLHLERLDPAADACVMRYFTQVQNDLQHAAARELTAGRARRPPLSSHREEQPP